MYTIKVLELFAEHNQTLSYFLIFLGTLIEGEFTLITSGILSHVGALSFSSVFIFALLGAFLKPFLGYWIGLMLIKYFPNSRFLRYMEKKIINALPHIQTQPFWSIFASKFIYGVNHLTLIFAGYIKMPFKKYLMAEFSATLIWLTGLLSLGYFFSYAAFSISRDIRKVSIIILLCVIAFIFFQKLVVFLFDLYESYVFDEEDKTQLKK